MMSVEKVFAKFENHPIMKQIRADESAKVLEQRKKAAAVIAKAKEKAEKVLPSLQAKVDAAVVDAKAAYDAQQALLVKCHEAQTALQNESAQIDRDIRQVEAELRENYDPCIDEAIQFFKDQWEAARQRPIGSEENLLGYGPMGERKVTRSNNHASIVDAMNYCRNAIQELEAMKLVPAVDVERIAVLKKGIPDPDKIVKVADMVTGRTFW